MRRKTKFVNCVVNRENLDALTKLLGSGDVRVVIDQIYPLDEAGKASPTCWGTTPGE